MLSVKIEFSRLIGIQAVQQQLFYTTKCICAKCFQAIAKNSKKKKMEFTCNKFCIV